MDEWLARSAVGPGRAFKTPTTQQALVKGIEASLRLTGKPDATRRAAAHVGVSARTWRGWRQGRNKTVPPKLIAAWRRAKLPPGREATMRNNDATMLVEVIVSNSAHAQRCNIGKVLRAHKPNPINFGAQMADTWLSGGDVAAKFNQLVDVYSGEIGMEVQAVIALSWKGEQL